MQNSSFHIPSYHKYVRSNIQAVNEYQPDAYTYAELNKNKIGRDQKGKQVEDDVDIHKKIAISISDIDKLVERDADAIK